MDKDTMRPENTSKPTQHTNHSDRENDPEERATEDFDEGESRSGIQGAGTG